MKITTIKPRGTASILSAISSGVHLNPCNEISLHGTGDITFEWRRSYTKMTEAMVDDNMWYTVSVSEVIAEWVREQNKTQWYEHNVNMSWLTIMDVHEHLYNILVLRWS